MRGAFVVRIMACVAVAAAVAVPSAVGVAGSDRIVTVAGTGTFGDSGDGGPATAAQLDAPRGVAVDRLGNVYIADYANERIRKVASDGTISTFAGNGTPGFSGDGGPATAAQLLAPIDVDVDAQGNLYIADFGNRRVRKVTTTGVISTVAGIGTIGFSGDGGPATSAQLGYPYGVAADAQGNLYIADYATQRVREVSRAGVISTVAGNGTAGSAGDGGPATAAQLSSPSGVAVDADGRPLHRGLRQPAHPQGDERDDLDRRGDGNARLLRRRRRSDRGAAQRSDQRRHRPERKFLHRRPRQPARPQGGERDDLDGGRNGS